MPALYTYIHTYCNYTSLYTLLTYTWHAHGHGDPLEEEANRPRLPCLPIQAMSQFTKLCTCANCQNAMLSSLPQLYEHTILTE